MITSFTEKGIHYDSSALNGLTQMECQTAGGQQKEYLRGIRWFHIEIP